MMLAHWYSGKPPPPVPNDGTAIERAWARSAAARTARVALAMLFASACGPPSVRATWITQRAARSWPVVTTASPSWTGPWSTASFSTASPPARLIAAATPWSIHSSVDAGVAIASTSSRVMSPLASSSLVLPTDVFM